MPKLLSDMPTSSHSPSGLRLTADFVAPIFVGVFLGYWLDRIFSTSPLFFLSLFFLGIAAGFLNLYRVAQRLENANKD